MPAYSLVRACMLDSKGVGWHQAPGWFHLKCMINCFEEKIWGLNCFCFFWLDWLPLKSYVILINLFWKDFGTLHFIQMIPYDVIRVFTVECILNCVILLCYTGLFCWWFWEMYLPIPLFLTLLLFGTPEYFPYILFYSCVFSLLSSGWFVIAVCGSISVQGTTLDYQITIQ